MVRRYVEDRLAELAANCDDYYRGLLDIHDDLVSRGDQQPEKATAGAMCVPEGTARVCLQTARQHLTHDD